MALSSFHFYFKLSQIFGIVPWINMETLELSNRIASKMYPIVLSMIILIQMCVQFIFSTHVINFSHLILAVTKIISTLDSIYIKRSKWMKFLHFYGVSNRQIDLTLYIGVRPILILVYYSLYLLVLRILSHSMTFEMSDLLVDLLFYVKLIEDCLAIYVLSILHKGFKTVNRFTRHHLNGILGVNISGSRSSGITPAACKKLYRNLFEISVNTNEIFGCTLGSSLFIFVVRLCLSVQFIINLTTTQKFDNYLVIRFTLVFLYRTVSNYLIIK